MRKRKELQPISEELIVERLRFENPWWITGAIDEDYNSMKPRLYLNLFEPLVEETSIKRAVVLMGPRRVGKTVMMHHVIQHLLAGGTPQKKICFINIENPIYNNIRLERLFALARKVTGDAETRDWFVFFDEIQYLKNWAVHLKGLVDDYPKTKFVVSGSASAALRMKSVESGAGRFTEFLLPPMTFAEFISIKGLEGLTKSLRTDQNGNLREFVSTSSTDLKALNTEFIDYLNYGGYPEVIFSDTIRANPGRYIRNDIVDKVLLRDLPSLYGIQDVQELNSLFTTLAYYTGHEVSLEALCRASGVEKYQLKKYLEYLESAFLIRNIHRIDESGKKFKRANFFKAYLTNPSLRSALFAPLHATDDSIGNVVETAIYAQLMHREWFTPWYARWEKGEVDLIGLDDKKQKPQWAVEIKWSNRYFFKPRELKSLLSFCKKNGLNSALVTTIDKEGESEVDGITFYFIPAAVYAYVIGLNTFDHKLRNDPNQGLPI